MFDPRIDPPEPASIRFLRRLTTVLTGVMILGLLTMIGLFVIRFWGADAGGAARGLSATDIPAELALPAGETVLSVTRGPGWIGVVTLSGRVFFYDGDGVLLRETEISLPERR